MSLLKQIDDKGAVLEWSPLVAHPNLVALGTKESAGVGFDDFGGELELHKLSFADLGLGTTLLGKARANSRFASLAWSQMVVNQAEYPQGLIAGGMVDGNIHVWDPAKLNLNGEEGLIASVEQHQGSINSLHFNPHKESSHLLASGGSDKEVYVTSLEDPDNPTVFIPAPPPNNSKHSADITKVLWNSQVAHILASGSINGSTFVWDLRQKRAWCELRDPAGGVVADIAWNPDQGLHIITASGDDKNPLIKLWDLRSSTTTPLATLHGHTEGILSVSWCPSDPSLLLSCGKDNKTLMWDLFNLQPVYELPCGPAETSQKASTEQGIFGSLATSASHRRYQISWSPCLPAVVAASSFDRRVQFYSVAGARSKIGRAPKWLRKPTGATFGFGGKLVTFNNRAVNAPGEGSSKSVFKIYQVLENKEFDDASGAFHSCLARGEYKEHCERQSREAATEYDRQVWGLMNVICFGANAREELLSFLGFDSSSIAEIASQKIAEADKKNPVPNLVQLALNNKSEPSENLFDVGPPTESIAGVIAPITDSVDIDFTTMSYSEKIKAKDLLATAAAGDAAEPLIRKAIVVGNFELAVEHCLKVGMIAEALLLAQCGDQSLRMKTQAAFFEMQRNKRPFLNVIHAVIKSELLEYVKKSDLSDWKETLALLSTYGKSEEFSSLCEALAERLEQERFDKESAALCYMCAANVLRVIYFWTEQLNKANIQKGHLDTVALQSFVEKVVIFVHANPVDDLGGDCYYNYAKYATLLANQGRLDVALGYLQGSSKEEHILIDRLYHAGSRKAGVKPPAFPFERVSVDVHAKTVTPAAAAAKSAAAAAEAQAKMTKAAASLSSSIDRNDMGKSVNSTPAAATGLPAGWIQLVDPNSGHPYYVNQTTGQSQWEPPAIIAVPERSTLTKSNSSSLSRGAANFGASSSVAAVAAVSVAAMPTTAPTIATPQDGSQVNAENVIVIGQFIEAINPYISSPADKKQLLMVRAAYQILKERSDSGKIDTEVMGKIGVIANSLVNRNFAAANAVQMELVTTAWNEHKEWLKGIKVLIQLASKR